VKNVGVENATFLGAGQIGHQVQQKQQKIQLGWGHTRVPTKRSANGGSVAVVEERHESLLRTFKQQKKKNLEANSKNTIRRGSAQKTQMKGRVVEFPVAHSGHLSSSQRKRDEMGKQSARKPGVIPTNRVILTTGKRRI